MVRAGKKNEKISFNTQTFKK